MTVQDEGPGAGRYRSCAALMIGVSASSQPFPVLPGRVHGLRSRCSSEAYRGWPDLPENAPLIFSTILMIAKWTCLSLPVARPHSRQNFELPGRLA